MPPVSLVPYPKFAASDANGFPLVGGRLYTYASGTTTPLATYTDATGVTAQTNPVILDARGEANVWLQNGVAYRYQLRDANDVALWTVDGILVSQVPTLAQIPGTGTSVATSNQTQDPGEAGTEVLATTALQDVQQLKFRIQEIAGGSTWRQTFVQRYRQGDFQAVYPVGATVSGGLNPTGNSFFEYRIFMGALEGYIAGQTLTFQMIRRWADFNTGTARCTFQVRQFRDGANNSIILSGDCNYISSDFADHVFSLNFTSAAYAPTDWINIEMARIGDDAADTAPGLIVQSGHVFGYTGIGGR
jgi:hypothetical protein